MRGPRDGLGFGVGALLAVAGLAVAASPPAGAQETGAIPAGQDGPEVRTAAQEPEIRAATQEVEARWLPWAGCWESVAAAAEAPMLCVRPTAEGAELLAVAGGEVTEVRDLRADGTERPVEEDGCTGVERGEPSDDVGRIYWSSELECSGRIQRESSRMWAFVGPGAWIEVRSVWVRGGNMASVDRYRAAPPSRVDEAGLSGIGEGLGTAIESARLAAAAGLRVGDIVEAHERVGPEIVEAWIAERGAPLHGLDADRLVELADAGVPPEVIDVAVAVSYPDRFRVDREPRRTDGESTAYPVGSAAPSGYYDPWSLRYSSWYSPYGSRFAPYGNRFSPFGPFGNRFGHYGGPTTIIVRPVGSDDDGSGRVFRDRGYRQGPSDRASSGRPASGARNAAPSRPSSSGSSTGRKAKPRDPPRR